MKIIGVIPARWGSTRFPGKSLAHIAGKPLVQWVYERCCLAKTLNEIIVATDDERIAQVVRSFGGTPVLTREDHPSGTDRVAEAISGMDADVVINIQGDEPLIDPAVIDRMGTVFSDSTWNMATAATPLTDPEDIKNPSIVKVVCDQTGRALYFSRSVIPFSRDDDHSFQKELYLRHIGLYSYTRTFLENMVATPPCLLEQTEKLEQLRALYIGARMKVLHVNDIGIGVDTPEDVLRAEIALKRAGLL